MSIQNIAIIGSGNLASNLALALFKAGKTIPYVYSRHIENAKLLANQVNAKSTNAIKDIEENIDLIIIAITDNAIVEVVEQLTARNTPVVHTSGSTDISALSACKGPIGVFYPLQVFSKNQIIPFTEVPICIEAEDIDFEKQLCNLGGLISSQINLISSEKRQILHLSAVFACNFTNLNYSIAEDILKKAGLTFELLQPLISETARRIINHSPAVIQTGPAIRRDNIIIQKHLNLLHEMPDYKELYAILTKYIQSINKLHE